MRAYHYFILLLSCAIVGNAAGDSISEQQATLREATMLSVEKQIADMVRKSRDWEESQFRSYQREDIDGDGVDDAVLLTTFEHDNGWRRELFVCLSSSASKVMHVNLGGKWERQADQVSVKSREIIIQGRKYVDGDAGCCPSQPYTSTFVVSDGKLVQEK